MAHKSVAGAEYLFGENRFSPVQLNLYHGVIETVSLPLSQKGGKSGTRDRASTSTLPKLCSGQLFFPVVWYAISTFACFVHGVLTVMNNHKTLTLLFLVFFIFGSTQCFPLPFGACP